MEHPCPTCKDPKLCKGSRDILKKCQPGSDPVVGPCEPFNQYVLYLRGQKSQNTAFSAEAKPDLVLALETKPDPAIQNSVKPNDPD